MGVPLSVTVIGSPWYLFWPQNQIELIEIRGGCWWQGDGVDSIETGLRMYRIRFKGRKASRQGHRTKGEQQERHPRAQEKLKAHAQVQTTLRLSFLKDVPTVTAFNLFLFTGTAPKFKLNISNFFWLNVLQSVNGGQYKLLMFRKKNKKMARLFLYYTTQVYVQ